MRITVAQVLLVRYVICNISDIILLSCCPLIGQTVPRKGMITVSYCVFNMPRKRKNGGSTVPNSAEDTLYNVESINKYRTVEDEERYLQTFSRVTAVNNLLSSPLSTAALLHPRQVESLENLLSLLNLQLSQQPLPNAQRAQICARRSLEPLHLPRPQLQPKSQIA